MTQDLYTYGSIKCKSNQEISKKEQERGPQECNSHGKTNECPTIRELTYEQPEVDYQSDEMVWHSQMQQ